MFKYNCPECGGRPHVIRALSPWDDFLVECSNCGFSYSEQGAYGDTPEEAIEIWDYNVWKEIEFKI